jgi:flagellar biosynthesis/type III secretory pathway chaperone
MKDDQLLAILGEQVRCAEAMLATLARENRALVDNNAGELEAASSAKATLVETLESLESQRARLADTVAADAPGGAEWARLRSLIEQCKEQNQRNGLLLKGRAENVRIALRTLRGGEPELYSPTGQTRSRNDARPLGSA